MSTEEPLNSSAHTRVYPPELLELEEPLELELDELLLELELLELEELLDELELELLEELLDELELLELELPLFELLSSLASSELIAQDEKPAAIIAKRAMKNNFISLPHYCILKTDDIINDILFT